jgi:hypothetical protein
VARALYLPEAAEVEQATKHLEDLEYELVLCDVPTFPPKKPPAQAT